jgi:N-acylglucosamine-6-phosphate 2-epimerase
VDGLILPRGLIVSCQAPPGSPLRAPSHLAALAAAAVAGGAVAIRAEGEGIPAIRAAVGVPVIGLRKLVIDGSPVYITPTLASARELTAQGADILAVDGTLRPRPGGLASAAFLAQVAGLGRPVLADIDSLAAGREAVAAGAAAVATTLAGYTGEDGRGGPDVELVAALAAELDVPVVAEGRYETPEQVAAAFAAGAHAVVVGTAITDALALTRRFVEAAP